MRSLSSLIVYVFFIANISAQSDTLLPDWVSYIANTSLSVRDVHSDCAGNVIYVGGTAATGFQGTPGTLHPNYLGGNSDAFVVKVNSSGQVVWATLLGGPKYDRAYAVEVDDDGFIYVAGRAGIGLETTECALQKTFAGDNDVNSAYGAQDGFVCKITPDGQHLVWSTYVGGPGREFIRDIDLDSEGNVWAALSTCAPSFPYITANAVQPTATHIRNPGILKLSSDGKTVLFSTFLSDGVIDGAAPTLRVDQHDNVYFLAVASTATIPVTPGVFQPTPAGGNDFEIAKFDPVGNLLFCSFLGGSGAEGTETHSLEVDTAGNVIVGAYSQSADYPIVAPAIQSTRNGTMDAVITKIKADGSQILYSTFLGGSSTEGVEGIGIDAQNRIYVTGSTSSADFPVTPGTAYQSVKGANSDGYLAVLSADLSTIQYATYFGGDGVDQLRTCHVDEWGQVHAGGITGSTNLPVFQPFQPTLTGANTGVAIRLRPADFVAPTSLCVPSNEFADPCLVLQASEATPQRWSVYPNPAATELYIDGDDTERLAVELLDVQGRVLFQAKAFTPGQRIEVAPFARGIYFIKIASERGTFFRKILLR